MMRRVVFWAEVYIVEDIWSPQENSSVREISCYGNCFFFKKLVLWSFVNLNSDFVLKTIALCTYSCCTFCIKLSVLPFCGTLHIGYLFGVEGAPAPQVLHSKKNSPRLAQDDWRNQLRRCNLCHVPARWFITENRWKFQVNHKLSSYTGSCKGSVLENQDGFYS